MAVTYGELHGTGQLGSNSVSKSAIRSSMVLKKILEQNGAYDRQPQLTGDGILERNTPQGATGTSARPLSRGRASRDSTSADTRPPCSTRDASATQVPRNSSRDESPSLFSVDDDLSLRYPTDDAELKGDDEPTFDSSISISRLFSKYSDISSPTPAQALKSAPTPKRSGTTMRPLSLQKPQNRLETKSLSSSRKRKAELDTQDVPETPQAGTSNVSEASPAKKAKRQSSRSTVTRTSTHKTASAGKTASVKKEKVDKVVKTESGGSGKKNSGKSKEVRLTLDVKEWPAKVSGDSHRQVRFLQLFLLTTALMTSCRFLLSSSSAMSKHASECPIPF